MKQLTAILIGAGARGEAYAHYALDYPHELKFVAVAESNSERLSKFAEQHGIPAERQYTSWEQILEEPQLADIAIISTQDRMHYEPTLKALKNKYHVMLEKPMSPDPGECIEMEWAAKENGRLLTICHVLRYTPFWSSIKRLITEGRIGEVVSIQLNENVGYWHMAHSFVRGNWNNSDNSSPMILAKSCHDMDVLSWLMDQSCLRVSSYGSLKHFHSSNAPEGSSDTCIGCAIEASCPYSAPRFYLGEGKAWARHFTEDLTRENIVKGLKETNYGRCVYKSDNNVVDHQVVNMEFTGGATATFSMCGFTRHQERRIQIMGTKGEIRGEEGKIKVMDFVTHEDTEIQIPEQMSGHGGGDTGIVRSFLKEVCGYNGSESLTSASASVRSHLMAFAAEQSRLNNGQSIELDDFYKKLLVQV
ncbi:Gfo/Idh/MocA family protein [Paenibacillus macquariensis]|uniref:Oxidoreductase family, C-terminal alpha/beta domain n=1 Tax=Paenibacillus macquariensis TaxID=948756 RepID=A0ABY1K1N0_9BACL|nr:Gfo/Idh/MocA family oxidoreductase [Paenibacillus macquariensis]MEC0091769.1 Gfo/Idh/MocA family oxidoreductase [Paenibacillus macquariensis]OAB32311.1 oxidoreductase [Paenibacillus macquariensis subsp. macquariensis]SIR12305.1 Oxidoreductase family, C-terminal alpha/beta domain [Paenibacillus macquariensis]